VVLPDAAAVTPAHDEIEEVSYMKCGFFSMLIVVCAVGAMATLGTAEARGEALDTIVVGPGANGTKRSLDRGDLLVVRLPSNPSTGYAWKVRSCTRPVLVLSARTYVPPKPSQRVGASGTAVLRFRAGAKGATALRLAYVRPWETGVAPAKTFTLRVSVAR
jgi:inhibitor of cysteine peptidase